MPTVGSRQRSPKSYQAVRGSAVAPTSCEISSASQELVATLVRSIFAQPNALEVWAQHARVVEHLAERLPEAADVLSDAAEDILAFSAFPKQGWRQIWSNNPQERLSREIRRRTDVVGIFPNRAAIVRLVGAVLAEQNDEWEVTRRYMSVGLLEQAQADNTPAQDTELDRTKEEHVLVEQLVA